MELVTSNNRAYMRSMIENVTQPELSVELLVRTVNTPEMLKRSEMISHYMEDQCKLLIPYFYELRNEMPRGRVQQMMNRRALSVDDPAVRSAYMEIIQAEEYEFAPYVSLQSVTIEGNRVSVVFACAHDPSFVMFQKAVEIPFSNPKLWAQVEAFATARAAEMAMAAEREAGKAVNDEPEDLDDLEGSDDEIGMVAGF